MGKRATNSSDLGYVITEGSLTSATTSSSFEMTGCVNVSFTSADWDTSIVQIERSFDAGTTWYPLACGLGGIDGGTPSSSGFVFMGPTTIAEPVSFALTLTELGVLYRVNCTTYGGTAISFRFSCETGQ